MAHNQNYLDKIFNDLKARAKLSNTSNMQPKLLKTNKKEINGKNYQR
jgi:hypothetical protein